jgi:probable selenium-dependent hydroxylase accessory protein YqeC
MGMLPVFAIAPDGRHCISVVGGGGKTTTIFQLARELKALEKKVLVTTTTNMFVPGEDQCDVLVLTPAQDAHLFEGIPYGTVVCLGGGLLADTVKLKSVDPVFIDRIMAQGLFDTVLVEADGAKRKPIKAPAHYEPVIPASSTCVIGVIGLDALGAPLDEAHVHRPELFGAVTGLQPGETVDAPAVVRLVSSPEGLFKGAPPGCCQYVLFNKADTSEQMDRARSIAGRMTAAAPELNGILAGSAREGMLERLA